MKKKKQELKIAFDGKPVKIIQPNSSYKDGVYATLRPPRDNLSQGCFIYRKIQGAP